MFHSSPGVGFISPLTFEKGVRRSGYFHLLFFVFVKQIIAQKLKQSQVRLNPQIVPSEVAISIASFFGDQGYLVSF